MTSFPNAMKVHYRLLGEKRRINGIWSGSLHVLTPSCQALAYCPLVQEWRNVIGVNHFLCGFEQSPQEGIHTWYYKLGQKPMAWMS